MSAMSMITSGLSTRLIRDFCSCLLHRNNHALHPETYDLNPAPIGLCPKFVWGSVQVRDVEASLQDAVLESFHDLLTSRAAAAGATGTLPMLGVQ